MNRRRFISATCLSCMSGSLLLTLTQGCSISSKIISATIAGSDLIVPLADFELVKAGTKTFKSHVLVQHEKLQYPICIYRFGVHEYEALLMKCTHQGTELQVFGDTMQCPAHGSEFSNRGKVVNGPASSPLRSFPVTITDKQIKISLI